MNKEPKALRLADDRPTSLDGLYQWAIDAEDELRRLHESNLELLMALEQIEIATACVFARNIIRAAIAKAEGDTQ